MNTIAGITLNTATANTQKTKQNEKRVLDAAQQFESLMMSELLKTAREAGSDGGWLGTGDDQAGQQALDLAEQQVSNVMAKSGGLGMRQFILNNLSKR
jgi:Rod binding domain-containing protein